MDEDSRDHLHIEPWKVVVSFLLAEKENTVQENENPEASEPQNEEDQEIQDGMRKNPEIDSPRIEEDLLKKEELSLAKESAKENRILHPLLGLIEENDREEAKSLHPEKHIEIMEAEEDTDEH